MAASRFVVGIDLGTTNSGVAYVDTGAGDAARSSDLAIPQVVQPGAVQDRPLLPSYLYLPGPGELPAGSLKLPWDAGRDYAVGEFARSQGSLVPTRLVTSAKSTGLVLVELATVFDNLQPDAVVTIADLEK